MDSSPASDASSSARYDDQKTTCEICGAKLSRPAHLQRHLKRHAAAVKTFDCQLCGKAFSRKDVYLRHKRSVHDSSKCRNGRRKSCSRCIRYKLRCSRELPCTACRNRPDQCDYGSGHAADGQADQHSFVAGDGHRGDDARPADLNDLVDAANVLDQSTMTMDETTADGHESNSRQRVSPLGSIPQELQIEPTRADPSECDTNGRDFAFNQPPGLMAGGILPPAYNLDVSLHNHVSEPAQGSNSSPPLDQFLGEQSDRQSHSDHGQSGVEAGIFDFPLDPWQLDLYGWDTLLGGETEPEGLSPNMSLGHPPHEHHHNRPQSTYVEHSTTSKDYSIDSTATVDIPREHTPEGRAPISRDVENKEYWPGVLDQGGNETWPFDYTSNKGFRRIKLPPLKQVLEQTVAHRPNIQKNILGDLIKVLSAPQIPSLNDTPALEAMPAVAFLGEHTRVYFAEFHNVYPVIHIPTWRIEKCATHLLAAMACIGATYSTAEGASEVSALFAEITQRALFWTGQQDSSAYRNTAYITASCFHQIYALGTGNRRLYEIADASRGLLVTSLRGLGILSSESGMSATPDSLGLDVRRLRAMGSSELEDAWLAWRDKETTKRMAWSVFEFDSTLSTMTSKKAAFRIAELPLRLPCNESLWEAHSARAWAALVPFTSSPAGLLFYPTLREVITNGKVPADAPAWAIRLCAVAIGRILYDLKEVQDASAPGVLGMPSMTEAHHETRQTLLSSLAALVVSMGKPMCTADVVNMNVLSLTYHRSHLISSGDETMDLVISIFRNSGAESSHSFVRSGEAIKDRLRHIFRSNPVNTRRMVFHAAAILAIARDCTINTPCETLSVFMGYAMLLAYVRFSPFEEHESRAVGAADAMGAIKLDDIPWMREPEAVNQVGRWIETGGPASLGDMANICNRQSFLEAKQGALDALARLSVWGLARKFRQTISKFV